MSAADHELRMGLLRWVQGQAIYRRGGTYEPDGRLVSDNEGVEELLDVVLGPGRHDRPARGVNEQPPGQFTVAALRYQLNVDGASPEALLVWKDDSDVLHPIGEVIVQGATVILRPWHK